MLKLNKSVHFNILCIFAIVFVCVYLYYTISDVKKIAVETKKNSQDVQNLITSIATLTKEVGELKKKAAVCTMTGGACAVVGGAAAAAASCKLPVMNVTPKVVVSDAVPGEPPAAGAAHGDNDSVNTDDVKNLLGDIPDDDEVGGDDDDGLVEQMVMGGSCDVEDDILESVTLKQEPKDYKLMSEEDLKKEKYEDLKDYCKRVNLSFKGNKEAIIQRILLA